MKYSTAIIAAFGITSVSSFPFLDNIGSLLKWSDHESRNDGPEKSDYDALRRRELSFNSPLVVDARDASDMMADAFSQIVGGGDIAAQLLRVAKDPNLTKDVLAFIKTPGNPEKLVAALSNMDLIHKLHALITNDKFIEDVATATADGRIGTTIMAVLMDQDGWMLIGAIFMEPKTHQAIHELLGSDDMGGLFLSLFGRPSITHLMASVVASFPRGPDFSRGMTAVAADSRVQENLRMMMNPHTNFATAFGKTWMDKDFVTHFAQLMKYPSWMTDRMMRIATTNDVVTEMMSQTFRSAAPPPVFDDANSEFGKIDLLSAMVRGMPSGNFDQVMTQFFGSTKNLAHMGYEMQQPANYKVFMAALQPGPTGRLIRFAARQILRSDVAVNMLFRRMLANRSLDPFTFIAVGVAGVAFVGAVTYLRS